MYKYLLLTKREKEELNEKTARFISSRHEDGTISIPAELLVIPDYVKVDDIVAQHLADVWECKNFCKTVSVIILDGICYVVAGANRARAIELMQSTPVVFCEVVGNTNTVSTEMPVEFLHFENIIRIEDEEIPCCFTEPARPGVGRVIIPGRAGNFKKFLATLRA